jgi:hypothetical protein
MNGRRTLYVEIVHSASAVLVPIDVTSVTPSSSYTTGDALRGTPEPDVLMQTSLLNRAGVHIALPV